MRIILCAIPVRKPRLFRQALIDVHLGRQGTERLISRAVNTMVRIPIPRPQMIRHIRKGAFIHTTPFITITAEIPIRRGAQKIAGVGFFGPVGLGAFVSALFAEGGFVSGE